MFIEQTLEERLETLRIDDEGYRRNVEVTRQKLLVWTSTIHRAFENATTPEAMEEAFQTLAREHQIGPDRRYDMEGFWFDVDKMLGNLDDIKRYPDWVEHTKAGL